MKNDDLFEMVDVADTSMAPTGTNKKVTWQTMKSDLNDTYLRLNGANGPLTGDIDTLNLLPDQPTAQIGTEQAPYQEVNAGRFKMPSDPGGFWALEKSADPANVLNFVRNDGSGDTIPYTLNPTGTPANATDLATKDYVDSAAGGVTVVPTPVQNEITIWDGPNSIKGVPTLKLVEFAGNSRLEFEGNGTGGFNTGYALNDEFNDLRISLGLFGSQGNAIYTNKGNLRVYQVDSPSPGDLTEVFQMGEDILIRNTSSVDFNMKSGTFFGFGNVDFSMTYEDKGTNNEYFTIREGTAVSATHLRFYKSAVAQNTDDVWQRFYFRLTRPRTSH